MWNMPIKLFSKHTILIPPFPIDCNRQLILNSCQEMSASQCFVKMSHLKFLLHRKTTCGIWACYETSSKQVFYAVLFLLQCCILLLRISSEVDSMMWWFSLISCHTRSLEWVFFSILIYQISLLKTNKCISFGSTSYRHSSTRFFSAL